MSRGFASLTKLSLLSLSMMSAAGCSSLDRYRDFIHVPTASQEAVARTLSTCEQAAKTETLQLILSNGARIQLSLSTTRTFGFVGVPVVPLIPFWRWDTDLLEVVIRSPDPIQFEAQNVYMLVGEERLTPAHPVPTFTSAKAGRRVARNCGADFAPERS